MAGTLPLPWLGDNRGSIPRWRTGAHQSISDRRMEAKQMNDKLDYIKVAQDMIARGSWIVPLSNGSKRTAAVIDGKIIYSLSVQDSPREIERAVNSSVEFDTIEEFAEYLR